MTTQKRPRGRPVAGTKSITAAVLPATAAWLSREAKRAAAASGNKRPKLGAVIDALVSSKNPA